MSTEHNSGDYGFNCGKNLGHCKPKVEEQQGAPKRTEERTLTDHILYI